MMKEAKEIGLFVVVYDIDGMTMFMTSNCTFTADPARRDISIFTSATSASASLEVIKERISGAGVESMFKTLRVMQLGLVEV